MGQRNVGDGLDFCHLQYPQIRLPLMERIERIIVGAQLLRQPAMPSNGAVEHPTEGDTIDLSRMDAEANDPARVLIHDHQDPVGPQRCRLALEQIHAPQAVFHVAQERQPGGAIGVLSRPVVMSENPANHVFVDLDGCEFSCQIQWRQRGLAGRCAGGFAWMRRCCGRRDVGCECSAHGNRPGRGSHDTRC